ncbi:MAG: hypothetical protein RLW87_08035 [Alphaproteobacteria bacterium]
MNSDTLFRLAGIFGELERILTAEAAEIATREATGNRMKMIDQAVRMAERLIMAHGLDENAAASAAADHFGLAAQWISENIARNRKIDLTARLQAAEKKRRRGASIRDAATAFNVPKSTLSDRTSRAKRLQ